MSSVPSMTSFIASHVCHREENEQVIAAAEVQKPIETESKSWLATMFNKFTIIGHDGVSLGSVDWKPAPERQLSATESRAQSPPDSDLLSRVRHLSDSSSDGSVLDLQPLVESSKEKGMSIIPER